MMQLSSTNRERLAEAVLPELLAIAKDHPSVQSRGVITNTAPKAADLKPFALTEILVNERRGAAVRREQLGVTPGADLDGPIGRARDDLGRKSAVQTDYESLQVVVDAVRTTNANGKVTDEQLKGWKETVAKLVEDTKSRDVQEAAEKVQTFLKEMPGGGWLKGRSNYIFANVLGVDPQFSRVNAEQAAVKAEATLTELTGLKGLEDKIIDLTKADGELPPAWRRAAARLANEDRDAGKPVSPFDTLAFDDGALRAAADQAVATGFLNQTLGTSLAQGASNDAAPAHTR